MTGTRTPIINLVAGMGYAVVLYYASHLPFLKDQLTPLPVNVTIAEWVYAAEAVMIIIASLSFNIVRQRRGARQTLSAGEVKTTNGTEAEPNE